MSRQEPDFTIVIPTYGRPRQLKECLDSVSDLAYPEGFEVIVVDDGSKTSLDDIVGAFRKKIDVKLLRQNHAGPATARNLGGHEAAGTYLAFTDDDCKPEKDWLTRLMDSLEQNPQSLVAGRTVNDLPENPYSTASQLIADFLYSYYNKDDARFVTSNNMAVSRKQFLNAGGFDTSFPLAAAEDREFCDRYIYMGHKSLYTPEAVVRHSHPLTLSGFWKQHFNYGQGAYRFHAIRSQRGQTRFRIEPFGFYMSLLLYPGKTPGKFRTALSFLIALSQLANASGYFFAKYSRA